MYIPTLQKMTKLFVLVFAYEHNEKYTEVKVDCRSRKRRGVGVTV